MVYSNHFVMCVLVNGNVQKELANGQVSLPFGTEYSLRFRNKNSRRAVVKIYIDGENVSGGGYVVNANDHIDIKRHHDKDRSFKFVSLDSPDAQDFGKDGPNPDKVKGTIEARFYLEKERPQYVPLPYYPPVIREEHHHHHHHDHYPLPSPWKRPIITWANNRGGTGDFVSQDQTSVNYSSSNSGPGSTTLGGAMGDAALHGGVSGSSCRSGDLPKSGLTRKMCRTQSAGNVSAKGFAPAMDSMDFMESEREKGPLQDGCTVEGNQTGQSFYTVSIDLEETYTSLKLFLQGHEGEVETVEEKPKKSQKVSNLEAENEALRQKLAELENAKLKAELEQAEKPKKKAAPRKKAATKPVVRKRPASKK